MRLIARCTAGGTSRNAATSRWILRTSVQWMSKTLLVLWISSSGLVLTPSMTVSSIWAWSLLVVRLASRDSSLRTTSPLRLLSVVKGVSRIESLAIDRMFNERGDSMRRYWQLATQDREAALYIYGDIVTEDWKWLESDVSGHELVQQLDQLDVDLISVYINSYGGFVSEAWAIHNALKRHKATIRTVCEGFAFSGASLILMAGDDRIMLATSALRIHNVQTFAAGDYKKLQSEAEGAKKLNELSMQVYLEHVNLSKEELAEMMDKTTWISPTEALEWGFATAIQSGGE